MNKEEQKAIETLEREGTENNYLEVKIVLDLIDKLQEENTILQYNYNNLKEERKDCIHKDKIIDKIKELEKCCLVLQDYKSCKGCESINCDMKIKYEVLEELLEE